jgi:uncharacterized protein YwbE
MDMFEIRKGISVDDVKKKAQSTSKHVEAVRMHDRTTDRK